MIKVRYTCCVVLALALLSCDGGGGVTVWPDTGALPPDSRADLQLPDAPPRPDAPIPDAGWPGSCHPSLRGLGGQALKAAIHALVKDHTSLGYSKARDAIFLPGASGIDLSGGEVECIYTGRRSRVIGDQIPSDMNVEHSWPQSMGASTEPARSDLHHLFPCDARANSRRGSLPFGVPDCSACKCSWTEGGSTAGYAAGCSQQVFKVRPARSGDIARAQFYFALRYKHQASDAIPADVEQTLRAWHAQDPVDARELARNGAIEARQNKRNPFVDCPLLPGLIADF